MRICLLNINRIFDDASLIKTRISLINHFSNVARIDNIKRARN